jgi:penicillin-binding protein 1C
MYASMARTVKNYFQHPGRNRYQKTDFHPPYYVQRDSVVSSAELSEASFISASSAFVTFETLKELYRPGEETAWRYFTSAKKIAWKTGTSFGFRDGWAVGVTPDYAVGVWVGNADGEGRPGLTGTDAAAPLMFDIFSHLPGHSWFSRPIGEMSEVAVCAKSGYRAAEYCDQTDTIWVSNNSLNAGKCTYHKRVHLTKDKKYQIHDQCADLGDMIHLNWFVLPPIEELYYKRTNLSYQSLPPFRKDCITSSAAPGMDMVYPKDNARIFIPRELDGSTGRSIFELAHRNASIVVFWHLDGEYMGSTQNVHRIELKPGEGKHVLTAVDSKGEILERKFEVISKK